MKENYFLDDGAYLIARLLIQMALLRKEGRHIDELIANLEEPAEAKEFRLNIGCEDFKTYGSDVIEKLGEFAKTVPGWTIEPKNYEGIRVSCDAANGDGWFLLRLSLHDPLLPLNIESNVEGGVATIATALKNFLKDFNLLDLSSLAAY